MFYAVGSTIVNIKLIADASNVGWRTSVNSANLCDSEGMLTLSGTNSKLVVGAHGKNYYTDVCGYHEELIGGQCRKLGKGKFSIDNVKHLCNVSTVQPTGDCACLTSNGIPVVEGKDGGYIEYVDESGNVHEYPHDYGTGSCTAHD